MMRLF